MVCYDQCPGQEHTIAYSISVAALLLNSYNTISHSSINNVHALSLLMLFKAVVNVVVLQGRPRSFGASYNVYGIHLNNF